MKIDTAMGEAMIRAATAPGQHSEMVKLINRASDGDPHVEVKSVIGPETFKPTRRLSGPTIGALYFLASCALALAVFMAMGG